MSATVLKTSISFSTAVTVSGTVTLVTGIVLAVKFFTSSKGVGRSFLRLLYLPPLSGIITYLGTRAVIGWFFRVTPIDKVLNKVDHAILDKLD